MRKLSLVELQKDQLVESQMKQLKGGGDGVKPDSDYCLCSCTCACYPAELMDWNTAIGRETNWRNTRGGTITLYCEQ